MRAIAAVIGVAAALGLCVWGGTLTYHAVDSLTDGARLAFRNCRAGAPSGN